MELVKQLLRLESRVYRHKQLVSHLCLISLLLHSIIEVAERILSYYDDCNQQTTNRGREMKEVN